MRGYTLIELLITVTIVVLLSGASLATFLTYRETSVVNSDANNVADRLRTIQTKATAVEIPATCANGVTGYVASYSDASLTVAAICPGIVGNVPLADLTLPLVNSTFTSDGSVTFQSRTISASEATICLTGSGNFFKIEVNQAANVSKPTKVTEAECP